MHVGQIISDLPGIETVSDREAQAELGLDHENSGELVVTAEDGAWLAYPWWTQKKQAPDYAGHVDIHNKPGYDPCELFFGWPPGTVSQNTQRIKGSHGRTGPGRDVTWATSLPSINAPATLVDLSAAIQEWLSGVTQ